jgi:hypothetical protein
MIDDRGQATCHDNHQNRKRIVVARAVCLFPGIIVAMLLTAIFLCLAGESPYLQDFVADPWTALHYVDGSVLVLGVASFVSGVFAAGSDRAVVHGPLRSLVLRCELHGDFLEKSALAPRSRSAAGP